MQKQLAAILVEPGRIELRDDVPVAVPGPGEILLRIEAATTCGTDLKMYRRGHPLFACPTPFGHEYAGVVAAVGRGVTRVREGDAVMAVHSAPCGDCRMCRRGLANLCTSLVPSMALGAYAQYVRLSVRHVAVNVHPKPAAVPFAEAALLEPLACVVYGWRQLQLAAARHAGQPPVVVVYGAGPIALLFLQLAQATADARVVVVARREGPRQRALALGAAAAVPPDDAAEAVRALNDGALADAAIDATGVPAVWERCTELVDPGGEVLFYGGCPSGTAVTLDTRRVHYDQLHLHGVFHFDPAAVREAAEWITSRRLRLDALLDATHPLTDIAEVFRRLDAGEADLKQVFQPAAL